MNKEITKRNHYNPCFWTAYWNPDFFDSKLSNADDCGVARDQSVYTLNIRSKTIYQTKVDNVFFEKNLGWTEVNSESMKKFCKKYQPSEYDSLCKYISQHPESVYLDFEDILQETEDIAYCSLIESVHIGGLSSIVHKGFLSCVLVIHAMRSYEMMTAMVDFSGTIGMDKWEYLWLLKNAWANKLTLARAVTPIAMGQWTFYRTTNNTFPICDSPIMISRNSVMALISPRLLLEIDIKSINTKGEFIIRDGISSSKYREFQLRAIKNTYKDIVFNDRHELQKWQELSIFRHRAEIINNPRSREQAIHEGANRVIWAIEGFGKLPSNFEQLVKPYFGMI